MAIILSPFAIFGLAAGGALLLVIVGTTAAILIGRRKHKRSLLLINARGARRLSGYPGGHVSMSDYDWLNMPRTRTLRSSRRVPSRYPRPYTPIASRESLPRHQTLRRPQRNLGSGPTAADPNVQQMSWPLPPRLTRSNVLPPAQVRGYGMSPVNERASQKLMNPSTSPDHVDVRLPQMSSEDNQRIHEIAVPTGAPIDSPGSNISSNTAQAMTPKPLFHDKQRSASLGTLPKVSVNNTKQNSLYVVDAEALDAQDTRLPRSTSLFTQQVALAPTEPLPPLPLNVAKLRGFQSIRSPTEHRESGNSLLSGETSILDDGGSKSFSQAETDFTSISMVSPTGLGSVGLGISDEDDFKWDSREITGAASPLDAVRRMDIRPQLKTQSSYRASIQNSLPRSASSGLSLSLLDRSPFRHPPTTTEPKDEPNGNDRPRLKRNQELEARSPFRQGISTSSPLSRNSMINIYEDPKPKRSSAILQDVSGNQGSPLHDGVKSRPLSVATSDPFRWETEKPLEPGKPSAMKGRARGHKRNSCVRISNIPVYIPSPNSLQPTAEEQEDSANNPVAAPAFIFGNSIQQSLPSRPPSSLKFDPQITPTPKPRSTRLRQRASMMSDSPAFSLLNLHNPSDSGPTSPFPTPTRRPTVAARNSGANPNRRIPIFDVPSAQEFVFATPEKSKQLPRSPLRQADADLSPETVVPKRLPNDESEGGDECLELPKPSSTLFPFPSPPHPLVPRGPRALPPTAWRRRSNSRSPTRISKGNLSGSWTYAAPATARSVGRRGSKDLRKSVIALRRMNSEAQEGLMHSKHIAITSTTTENGDRRDGNSGESSKGHKRFLSLGDDDSNVGFERENEGFELVETRHERERSETSLTFERVLGGPRLMPGIGADRNIFGIADEMGEMQKDPETPGKGRMDGSQRWSRGTPGSVYDENGFLKDGGRSPAKVSFPTILQ